MACIPAIRFLQAEELVLLAMGHCDIGMLVSWSHISPFFWHIIQGIIESRLKVLIRPYVPSHLLQQFFAVLDKTSSLIAGSTALAVLTPMSQWKPRDVNILVPRDQLQRWVSLFKSVQYSVASVGRKGSARHERYPVRQRGVAAAVVVCSLNPEVRRIS